jgi:hypothetical protein
MRPFKLVGRVFSPFFSPLWPVVRLRLLLRGKVLRWQKQALRGMSAACSPYSVIRDSGSE